MSLRSAIGCTWHLGLYSLPSIYIRAKASINTNHLCPTGAGVSRGFIVRKLAAINCNSTCTDYIPYLRCRNTPLKLPNSVKNNAKYRSKVNSLCRHFIIPWADLGRCTTLTYWLLDIIRNKPSSTPVTMEAKLSSSKIMSAACLLTSDPAIPIATPAEQHLG